ncbi:branched-chain amino acid ABC transporter permease [Microbacterium sp. CPCC 204701]|uniref:branched-chain amino acid ABC transporter permease n=1 Tax=Microbacterium sp. CPCC 204701 TaxID=2493084 RepID=UPI000FD8BA3F|nr:branched-chain amino acid ABC transporter permease [Microbacterium sp. CPCC 204701]
MTSIKEVVATGTVRTSVVTADPTRWARTGVWIAVALIVLLVPLLTDRITMRAVGDVAVFAVVIMSSNLLTGVTGQISLAQGAFFGMGAYTTAMLVQNLDMSYWASLPIAVLVAATVGAIAGLPALRIAGLHLALVTLGLALVFPTAILRLGDAGGGPAGLSVDKSLEMPPWFPFADSVWTYWVLAIVMLLVLLASHNLLKSRTGRTLFAIRDQPLLAAALGTNVRVVKVVTFAGASGLAGLAGWMFTAQHHFVSPADFGVFLSLNILLAMTLGGAGTVAGPLLGAIFLRFIPDVSDAAGVPLILAPAVTGVILILALLFLPQGLAGIPSRVAELWRRFIRNRTAATGDRT